MKKLIYLLLFVISWPSLARQFDVEVILFKRNIAPEQVNELWPDQLPAIDYSTAIDLGDTASLKARGIRPMSSSRFQLNGEYNKLKQHAGFTPLAHFGWRQGDLSKAAAPEVHFAYGKDFSGQFLPDGTSRASAQAGTASDTGSMTITSDNSGTDTSATHLSGAALYELEGKMKVYVQHYLFTEATFDLREPSRREVIVGTEPLENTGIDPMLTPSADASLTSSNVQVGHLQAVNKQIEVEEFLKSYRFDQQRQMGSNELHYIDHPLLGMIIQIRRL
ncbi:peptidoglycan binding protein CsiV [Photobacterium japonica]|uniref:peptidoglycan binding protein CsiV n=1 Tax=Photobacterium japonica TaxID=2910235 RepID=UPI003D0E3EE7